MNRTDLTQGSIWGNITTFLLPYILAYFLQILYGLADLFVIGRYCGVDSTTAVSNGAQVMYFVTCVVIGLAMGTTVNTAHAIGAKDQRRASRVIGNTATMFFILSILLALVLLCCRDGIVRLMDTPPEAVEGTRDYLMVCFIGIPFIMAYNVIASIFRGLGDSKSPMYSLL
ncbi:MAG: MATE family efflux transporter [Segatella copri]